MAKTRGDDRLTVIAVAALACILQDILHEGLGHGVTAWLSGAHRVTMSTVALQSDLQSRLVAANGTLVNLLFGAIFWLLLRRAGKWRPVTRYFAILALMGNLFTGTGYFFFSGVTNFGDWAEVIRGLEPHWAWRIGLVAVGVASYYGAMLLVGAELLPFRDGTTRIRRLCWTPYFTDGALAGVAGLLNPAGLFYVIASALPSTLGANAGLLSLPFLMFRWPPQKRAPVPAIERSWGWIAAGGVAGTLFIIVLGRGITWSR